MPGGKEGYQPSEEEMQAAEGHLTEKEVTMSEAREEMASHKDQLLDPKSFIEYHRDHGKGITPGREQYEMAVHILRDKYGQDWANYVKSAEIINTGFSSGDRGSITRYRFLVVEKSGEEKEWPLPTDDRE